MGCDINSKCGIVLHFNLPFFPDLVGLKPDVEIGSILDPEVVQLLRGQVAAKGGFDVVHWWGALYHTGNMRLAIERAASLVRPRGALVIAIYNRHWSSPAWLMIKYAYCESSKDVQRLLVWTLVPVVYVANWLVTIQNRASKRVEWICSMTSSIG